MDNNFFHFSNSKATSGATIWTPALLEHGSASWRDYERVGHLCAERSLVANAVVGNRTLRVGQYVNAGTQLMSLVPVASAFIVANYKETQLAHVRAGQSVAISVDTYPGRRFRGHIDSLSPASGQEFALLPPTGNFTKVVQRIPVKIARGWAAHTFVQSTIVTYVTFAFKCESLLSALG
jgi:Barrel-sandwich domain of CusB or HlyD membrane-fusion